MVIHLTRKEQLVGGAGGVLKKKSCQLLSKSDALSSRSAAAVRRCLRVCLWGRARRRESQSRTGRRVRAGPGVKGRALVRVTIGVWVQCQEDREDPERIWRGTEKDGEDPAGVTSCS